MTKYYTGVGARATPIDVCKRMTKLATQLEEQGWILRSGHADGSDMAFEDGVEDPLNKEIYIPWKGFNGSDSKLYPASDEAFRIAWKIHKHWNDLTPGARKLHARNIHQVLGKDLKTPSKFLICWTLGGKDVGGTRTAIILARQNNIPVYNLFSDIENNTILFGK